MRSLAESGTRLHFLIPFQVYSSLLSLEFTTFVKAFWKLTKLHHWKPYIFKHHSIPTGWKSVPYKWLVLGVKWLAEILLVLSSWLTSTPWKLSSHRSVFLLTVPTLCPCPFVQNCWKRRTVSSMVIWNFGDCIFHFTRGWSGWRLDIAYSKLAVFHYLCDESFQNLRNLLMKEHTDCALISSNLIC